MSPGRTSTRARLTSARLIGAVCAVLLPTVSGCYLVPSQPDASSWRIHAQRETSDVAAALSTFELVLRNRDRGRFIANYAQVTLANAEEMAGKASDKFSSEQAPPVEQDRATKIGDAMDQAANLIENAREEVVDGRSGTCSRYCDELDKLSKKFQSFGDDLKHPPASAAGAVR